MVVILDNDRGRVELETSCIELSVDRTHLLCHLKSPEDFIEFDLRNFRLFEIRDFNNRI